MDTGSRQHFIFTEYSRWLDIIAEKHPEAAVLPWLKFTTGTGTTKVDGKYLFRNFQEGLRVFHRDLNIVWQAVLLEGISGKSKEEVWCRFCYLYYCRKVIEQDPENVTPEGFNWKRIEQKKWLYTFKYMGPCCEFLELGEGSSHEFLSNPVELSSRGTSKEKRKAEGTVGQPHRCFSTPPHSKKKPTNTSLTNTLQVCLATFHEKTSRDEPKKPWRLRMQQSTRPPPFLLDAHNRYRTSWLSTLKQRTRGSSICINSLVSWTIPRSSASYRWRC